MYKRNGWYYVFAPAGGVKTGWQTVLRSRNVFGPYEYKVVMRQGDSIVNGPHQGAWVDTVNGEDWFLHFQDVYAAGRITHLQPMSWKEDWPVIGVAKEGNDYGEPVMEYRKPTVGAGSNEICEPETSDGFTGNKLGLQWQWNANPEKNWYELTGNSLKLNAVFKETVYGDMPNLLLQKWPAPEFSCVTKLDLSNLEDREEAGVISMGTSYGLLTFRREGDSLVPYYVDGVQKYGKILPDTTEETEKLLPAVSFDKAKELYIKYTVKQNGTRDLNANEKGFSLELVTLEYGTDGSSYQKAGEMTAMPGRWVGVKNGVFCASPEKESRGYAIVESVTYEKCEGNH